MKKIKFTFLLFLVSIFLINCKHTESRNPENYIEIYALRPGILYPFSINCNMIRGELFKEGRRYQKITDAKFMSKFLLLYNNYEPIDKLNGDDNRIQVLIHRKNKVDTLCLGENFFTHINGKRMKDSPELLKLIKDKIDF